MNLLLLLSALLSALTGVGGARGASAPQVVCAAATAVRAARVAAISVGVRPVQAPPPLAAVLRPSGTAWALAAAEPLYASRRRE